MNDIKMADVFKGDVRWEFSSIEAADEIAHGDDPSYHLVDDTHWLASSKEHMEAAAHAINNHDRLVARVKELEGTLHNVWRLLDEDREIKAMKKVAEALANKEWEGRA